MRFSTEERCVGWRSKHTTACTLSPISPVTRQTLSTRGADYIRVYGMRADTESLNAQFERAFYNRRLPAWELHNQTVIVLMAALAQNAWARHTWQRAIDRQQSPPQVAA
jgi:hypothetical protein